MRHFYDTIILLVGKSRNTALIAATSCMLLNGCTTHQAPVPPPPNETNWDLQKLLGVGAIQEWALTVFVSEGETLVPIPTAKATLSMPRIGTVSGTASINRYSGRFTLYTGDRISWTSPGYVTTKMVGPADFTAQEGRFLATLRATDRITVTRRSITFSDAKGANRMTFSRIRR